MTGSPATGPKTHPLARPPTLRLIPNGHGLSASDPGATFWEMSHINHSLCQTGHSDTAAEKLNGASCLLAAHGILQLTQSACREPIAQKDGAGNQRAGAVPFATCLEIPGEQAVVEYQGSPLQEKQVDGLARSREKGELGRSHEEGELRQAMELSQRFLRPLWEKETYKAGVSARASTLWSPPPPCFSRSLGEGSRGGDR